MLFLVATITPFDSSGKVDLGRLRAHVLWLIAKGVEGFVPTGTTGEFVYLSDREREAIHRTVLDAARGLPVYPCTWDPNPATTRYLTEAAQAHGASGVIVPPPLFYELDSAVVEQWYRQIAENSSLPVLGYHEPARIPAAIQPELYSRLRAEGVLAGLSDASGDPYRLQRLCDADPGAVYSSDDRILADAGRIRFLGGVISAIGNLWPEFCLRILKHREEQLVDALVERVNLVREAGGLRAIKAELGMGFRPPLIAPDPSVLAKLPRCERS